MFLDESIEELTTTEESFLTGLLKFLYKVLYPSCNFLQDCCKFCSRFLKDSANRTLWSTSLFCSILLTILQLNSCKKFLYTGCFRPPVHPFSLRRIRTNQKYVQTKVVGFQKIYSMILSVWPWMASPRSDRNHIKFFKWNTLFLIPESNSWCQDISKTL